MSAPTALRPSAVGAAYDAGTARWVADAEPLYDRLAAAIVAAWPGPPLAEQVVLEIGAGSGALTRALARAGACPVPVDLSPAMLASNRRRFAAKGAVGWAGVVGDAGALPVRPGAVAVAAGAFVLSHLPDPAGTLQALAGLLAPGGTVVTASFAAESVHPAVAVVDAVASAWGWQGPQWYVGLRTTVEPVVASPGPLAALHRDAGFAAVFVTRVEVELGALTPSELVAWRLGLAHLGSFLAALAPSERADLTADAVQRVRAELGPGPHPVRRAVLLCSSTVAPHARNVSV